MYIYCWILWRKMEDLTPRPKLVMEELWRRSLGSRKPLWRQKLCGHDDGKGEELVGIHNLTWREGYTTKCKPADQCWNPQFLQVLCVQMVALLGVDILFQDVDIVWYRNPLEFFHDESKWLISVTCCAEYDVVADVMRPHRGWVTNVPDCFLRRFSNLQVSIIWGSVLGSPIFVAITILTTPLVPFLQLWRVFPRWWCSLCQICSME